MSHFQYKFADATYKAIITANNCKTIYIEQDEPIEFESALDKNMKGRQLRLNNPVYG